MSPRFANHTSNGVLAAWDITRYASIVEIGMLQETVAYEDETVGSPVRRKRLCRRLARAS